MWQYSLFCWGCRICWFLSCILITYNWLLGLVGRVFVNGLWDLGSIPGRVIPKTLKIVLDTSLLNTQQYKVLLRVKWSNPGKGAVPSPTPRCSSYWKGSFPVALDYSCQLLLNQLIGLLGKVFINGLRDLGSIPDRVIPKTLKIVLDTSLLNTQQYKVLLRVKWSNPGKGVVPSPTPRCSSYWKGNLLVTLDYSRQQLYFFILIMIEYIWMMIQIQAVQTSLFLSTFSL